MENITNFINGEYVEPLTDKYLDVFEPATGKVYAQVPSSGLADVEIAVDVAQAAFGNWSRTSMEDRATILIHISEWLHERSDEMAVYESRDTGKPISMARTVDIPRAITNLKFFAEYVRSFEVETILDGNNSLNRVSRSPLGVVGCISPWNLPLYLFTWKIAPALAVGNCVIAKPSEITPYTAFKFGEICVDAGLPEGVLNIVHGPGVPTGDALVTHHDVKAISFTGGTDTGKIIAGKVGSMFKKLSLEMGGKNPAIIFSDCNYEKMLETVVRSSFSNQGQICLCTSRILVQDNIMGRFRSDFIRKVDDIQAGDPIQDSTDFGAISSEVQREKIMDYIALAKSEGGKVLRGGLLMNLAGRCENGWFIEPTIIEGLGPLCRTNQEEIFGPVVTLIPFKNETEAIEIANSTEYGLSATIWTEDPEKANRVSDSVESGVIWVNCWMVRDLRTPFGGMKRSGLGREGGDDILRFFTESKNICTA